MKNDAEQPLKRSGLTQNNWLMGLVAAVILINLTVTILIFSQLHDTNLPVPVRFTSLTNFDQLGSWQTLYLFPGLIWLFTVVNVWLSHSVYHRSRITSFMLIIGCLGFGFLALQMTWLYLGVTSGAH